MKKNAILAIFLGLLISILPVYAGSNPFSGVVTGKLDDSAYPSTASNLPPIVDGKTETATVDVGSSLNIRTSPWGDIVGNFVKGDKVKIIGQSGDWYKIEHNGKTAFVHSAYVQRKGEKSKPHVGSAWVNAPIGLNVRRVPHGDKIGVLPDQASVEILGASGGYYKIKWGDNNEAFVDRRYIDHNVPSAPKTGVVKKNFVGYIANCTALNVRKSPWGPIDKALPKGIAVKVIGKVGDWYQISYNGKTRYVYAKYISTTKNVSPTVTASKTTSGSALTGSEQQRIVKEAQNLLGSKNFRSASVNYGTLACAQVVTTALKSAGALNKVHLNCRSTLTDLRSKGWKEVKVPPFEEGDVITWKTYDYTGDGVKDPDTHIGIMVKSGNTFKAMNNSSRLRTPRLSDPFSMNVSRVMRKVA